MLLGCIKPRANESQSRLDKKLAIFRTKSQGSAVFDIKKQCQSSTGWLHSIEELQAIKKSALPTAFIDAMMATIKSIYEEAGSDVVLGADDLTPILCYVVAQCGIPQLYLKLEMTSRLCGDSISMGETG